LPPRSFAPAALAGQASKSTSSPATLSALDAKSAHYAGVAKQIWGFAELGYQEYKSSALLRRELATAGFKVDSGVAGMPTAFIANYGSGKPCDRDRR
jgi:aminobenzoyl-glutamate utilization protein B